MDLLASFALHVAFPRSDYYDASDASGRHRWTAHLSILREASHVHEDGLSEGMEVAVISQDPSRSLRNPAWKSDKQVADSNLPGWYAVMTSLGNPLEYPIPSGSCAARTLCKVGQGRYFP